MAAVRPPAKPANGKPDEPEQTVETNIRPPSPPPHTAPAARGVVVPTFSAFHPRDVKPAPSHPVAHVAWSCDGRRLASVGTDKSVRLWSPEKNLETRHAQGFHGGHEGITKYVAWNPSHPELFCSASGHDNRVVFWDARQSRHLQSHVLPHTPSQLIYSPNGKTLGVITTNNQLHFLEVGQTDAGKTQWTSMKRDPLGASVAVFNHAGTGLALGHTRSSQLKILDFPSDIQRDMPAAHVGGCSALAMDPRGRYLVSGGYDSIINIFDVSEWICVNTITSVDHSINSLNFSYDGEYLAVANQGHYVEICSTETARPLHRLSTPGSCSTVQWHPTRYVIAYCGQAQYREGTAMAGFLGLFGT